MSAMVTSDEEIRGGGEKVWWAVGREVSGGGIRELRSCFGESSRVSDAGSGWG